MKLAREASSSSQLVELASSCKRRIIRRYDGDDDGDELSESAATCSNYTACNGADNSPYFSVALSYDDSTINIVVVIIICKTSTAEAV